jgi:hypothetical protein
MASEPPELHLDFAEEFFGAMWKRWRKRKLDPGGCAARFDDLEVALTAVVQAFATDGGRRLLVKVAEAEASGGVHQQVALLPRWIALSEDHQRNREFFFTRAAIAGAMIAWHGVGENAQAQWGENCESEDEYLRHAEVAIRSFGDAHPPFAQRVREAAQLELEVRPHPHLLAPGERKLEASRQQVLMRLCEWTLDPELSNISTSDQPQPGETTSGQVRSSEPTSEPIVSSETTSAQKERAVPKKSRRSKARSAPILLLGSALQGSQLAQANELSKSEEKGIAIDANEVEAPKKDHIKRIMFEEDPYKANMPEHAFEKVMFAEKYDGGQRRMDGEDDMDEHQDSLDAVDLRELIRGGPEVHSIYKADIGDGGEIPDVGAAPPASGGISYKEWNEKDRSYRQDWVTIFPTAIQQSDPAAGLALSKELSPIIQRCLRRLQRKRTERLALSRQLDGDIIDLAGVVDDHATLQAGRSPSGRVYVHKPKLHRDQATTVLLDISLSADSWIDNRRVLDVEMEAACVLGEIAERMGDDLQILAYASHTRNHCRVWQVKNWDDSWPTGRARLSTLKPQGYTRIGPAIRHGTKELLDHPARRKHLILITDAKPTDFDRYEGNYGIYDVRQAVREGRADGIGVHALGIDPKSAAILPTMFGVSGWKLLRSLTDLPEGLLAAYSELG